MTWREWSNRYLFERGMFEDMAAKVTGELAAKLAEEGGDWFDRPMEGYPESFGAIVRVRLNSEAVDWIDANLPAAWFRPMFAGTLAAQEATP